MTIKLTALRLAGAALFAVSLAACAGQARPPAEPPPSAQSADPGASPETCKAQGGTIQPVGMMGREYCVIPYKDGGKTCANDEDCEGECWVSGVAAGPNPDVHGTCQPTNMPFGCNSRLDKGVVSPVLCVD